MLTSQSQYVNLILALEDKSGITKVIRIQPLETMSVCTNLAIYLTAIQSGPTWWIDRPTKWLTVWHCHPLRLAWLISKNQTRQQHTWYPKYALLSLNCQANIPHRLWLNAFKKSISPASESISSPIKASKLHVYVNLTFTLRLSGNCFGGLMHF